MNKFPKNILIVLTHASYFVPDNLVDKLEDDMKKNNNRLLKNFSDWGTTFLVDENIPKEQIIEATFSRAIGDPNRDRNSADIFRSTDFGGINIWNKSFTDAEKETLLEEYYDKHHGLIKKKISELKENHEEIFIIDIHDTGNYLMGVDSGDDKLKDDLFPELALCDCEGLTLNSGLKAFIETSFSNSMNLQIVWNNPYKKSFTSGHYYNKEEGIYTLQVEFGRYLLIDEKTQTYNAKVDKIKNGLYKSLFEIGEFLKNKKY